MTHRPTVQFDSIAKRFPGVVALQDITLDVAPGSCHAIVGENGAGKSTLGKILAGLLAPDGGEIRIDGNEVRFAGPRDAMLAGIGMVHQELLFCENLTVAENLCLGRLPHRGPFVSRKEMLRRAQKALGAIHASVDVRRPLGELPISQQQLVQIAAAVSRGARVLIFDEPTSSLSQAESEHLFELIRRLQKEGVTAIYVSHRLEEIFRLCDAVTVLRDGKVIATSPIGEVTQDELVQMMIGRPLAAYYPVHIEAGPGEELLRVQNFSSPGKFDDIFFSLRAGEVLGLAGLVGAGRTELTGALFGLDPHATGHMFIAGQSARSRSPQHAMELGIGLVPEDRKRHGLVLSMKARENISLPTLDRYARFGWIRTGEERALARKYFEALHVRAPHEDVPAASLSGGNQQKLVLAKWLAARCRILIVDEPTRGVDVGAKAEIHGLIDRLAQDGNAVLLISSDLPEIINLSTRILVMRDGRICGEIARDDADQEKLMRLMAGVSADEKGTNP